MAPTRKSAKRASRKKGKTARRGAATKRPARKAAGRRQGRTTRRGGKTARRRATAKSLKRRAKQGLAVAREGLDTVRQAGERTWETLKSTTSQVVEGVRDRLGEDSGSSPGSRYP
jgi:hypothetical protein